MFMFNKSKVSKLFLTFFTLSLFNTSCMADDAVKIGEVSYGSNAVSYGSDASDYSDFESEKVAINKGIKIVPGSSLGSSTDTVLTQTNDGDMVVNFEEDPLSSLDGYILKGNVINYSEDLHLVTYDSVPPLDCDLYVRAIKVKDGYGNDIDYDPNTSDTTNDSGWLKYEGRATFDYLASTTGLWHTYAVRYKGEDFNNDYGVKYIVLDSSRSIDGINRYTLLDADRNVIMPDTDDSYGADLDYDYSDASASLGD